MAANKRCLTCHGQSEIETLPLKERLQMVAPATQPITKTQETRAKLHVTDATLANSTHAKLACVQCHTEAQSLPHAPEMKPVSCSATCHTNANSDYLQGAHAEAVARGDTKAPSCGTCHGDHDILPSKDRSSRTFPLNIVKVCGDCHKQHKSVDGKDGEQHILNYLDSVHGRAVVKGGLAVAATCADCHSNHRVLKSSDARSTVNRDNVAKTCGRCHTGVSDVYNESVHGKELVKGNKDAPVCNDCHTAHSISRTDTPAFMLDIVNECGHCHNKPMKGSPGGVTLYQSYRESYHGQVTRLGMERAARCSSCHGAHDAKRIDDPTSKLHESNRIEACRQCHKGADAKFAAYQAHADPTNMHRSPVLFGVRWYFIVMMSAAFGFFGLHSVLWFARSLYERLKHGPHAKHHHHSGKSIKRFNRVDRVNHAFVIISFFGLTVTGLPLLYADKAWGQDLVSMLGGPRSAGILHRCFAIMLIINFIVHGVGLLRRVRKLGIKAMIMGPLTMMPRWKDITDCMGMWKWFFKGGSKPKFDRWTYWEKFDYVAEVGGSGIIGATGLLLWFPVFFSQFVPGWMFNVAQYIHGFEALLAIGFIFTIHFFNAHLRLEKFPVDDVMFSGSLPEEEFKEERTMEYERLMAEGKLDELVVAPPPKRYRIFAVFMGITAMAIGTTLVVLIILAGLNLI
jgi:cytochrome b subunit of formate dehydrogenase